MEGELEARGHGPGASSGTGGQRLEPPTTVAELVPRSWLARRTEDLLRFVRKGFARVAELAPTRLNFSWITESLAIGGTYRTADMPRLRRLEITAVVDCREEASDDPEALARHGIAFLHLPAPDARELSPEALDTGVAWVTERIQRGEKVYVHCSHGVGRGPLLGCCILVASGSSGTEALRLVKSRRWQASPNEEQLDALVRYVQRRRKGDA